MKIKILTVGTRGDVQPFVALGKGLVNRGHAVTIVSGENFREFVERNGVGFEAVRIDYLELTQSDEGKKMMSGNPLEIFKNMKTLIFPMIERMLEDLWRASMDAEILIYHPKAFGGYDIAEKLGIPAFLAHPIPLIAPTKLFTNPALPVFLNIGIFNKISFKINVLLMGSFFKFINKWRQETLSLPKKRSIFTNDLKLNGKEIPVLYGCSPQIIPFDTNWGSNVSMEGFWFLEEEMDWVPSEELLHFLNAGPPPIAISFSSMPLKDPEKIWAMLEEALRLTGQRGIFITGWSGVKGRESHSHILTVDSIPHSWLFPRTAGVIHHGGAGTTAAVLKSGKPMLICPFSADQPFWAKIMQEHGTAAAPLKEKDMSAEAFVDRIQVLVSNEKMRKKAVELSRLIKEEKGIEQTIDFIEDKVKNFT